MSAKYARACESPGHGRNCRYSLLHRVRLEGLTDIVDFSWDIQSKDEPYEIFLPKERAEKKALRFCFILKMFSSSDICMFHCPLFINEYADHMLPVEVNIFKKKKKSWLSKINIRVIFIVKPFFTEMCILSNIFFFFSSNLNNITWAWHLEKFTHGFINPSTDLFEM